MNIEVFGQTKIGYGLYIGHPYGLTINPAAVIGNNCNIHKGLLIGQENRGKRKGTPTIGNDVWIGVNVAIVGKITIGDDVLIAPNTYVNCDVPSHSVVFGNPCVIKHNRVPSPPFENTDAASLACIASSAASNIASADSFESDMYNALPASNSHIRQEESFFAASSDVSWTGTLY